MLKEFLWETFKQTGSIDAYVFFKEVEEKNEPENETMNLREELILLK